MSCICGDQIGTKLYKYDQIENPKKLIPACLNLFHLSIRFSLLFLFLFSLLFQLVSDKRKESIHLVSLMSKRVFYSTKELVLTEQLTLNNQTENNNRKQYESF